MVAKPANDDVPSDLTARYVDRLMRIPMLTAEEELRLTRLWRDARDPAARERVMDAHLRITVRIARQFAGYGIGMDDLMDEGAMGLSRAMDKFDPERGFRFVTYATWWIRASVMDLVLRTSYQTPMGTTAASKKLFFALRGAKARLGIMDGESMTDDAAATIAHDTGTTVADVVAMDRRMRRDVSLDVADPTTGITMLDAMMDAGPLQDQVFVERQEAQIRTDILHKALDVLKPRERHIVEARRLNDDPMTLEALSQVYGVTRERIRQIEVKALDRLQSRVLELARMRRYVPEAA